MIRIGAALCVLGIVVAACSPAGSDGEPAATPVPTQATTTPPPPPATSTSTLTTLPPPPSPSFTGTAPVTVFVAGTLWDLGTSPATDIISVPATRTSPSDPVATSFGIVVAGETPTGSGLWLADPDSGETTQLAANVGSFGIAADDETVAWAEHLGTIGASGSQTQLTESSLPGFDTHHTITVDGFARVAGYAGDLVLLETGDGEAAVVMIWAPADGTLTAAPGYVSVLATNPVEESAVLATENAEARWVVVLGDDVLPAAEDDLDPPWELAASRAARFSPDGATVALSGERDETGERVVTFRSVTDRTVVEEISIEDLPGEFFAPVQLTWLNAAEVALLAETWDERSAVRPHAGQRFVYRCSLETAACDGTAEIVYEPQTFDEVALVVSRAPIRNVVTPVEGWRRIELDPGLVGDAGPVAARGDQGVVAIAGCHRTGPADWFPLWVSADGERWERAEGPDVTCLRGLVTTEFGWLTWGGPDAYVSADARTWVTLDGPWAGEPGWIQFVASTGTVTSVVRSQAAENETTIASLWTSTDGITWTEHAETAAIFDNSDVAAVRAGGPGLVAVGASPGGEFEPTAAVWTSADGTVWELVTPRDSGFDGATMFDVAVAGPGLVAVGTDWAGPAFWWSDDGVTWTRTAATADPIPEFGHVVAENVTVVDGVVYAAGFVWDADEPSSPQARLWISPDGRSWAPVDAAEYSGRLPFGITGFEAAGGVDRGIGYWPPPGQAPGADMAFFITE